MVPIHSPLLPKDSNDFPKFAYSHSVIHPTRYSLLQQINHIARFTSQKYESYFNTCISQTLGSLEIHIL